ncbi:MAG: LTA synthase family protein, partial [Saprospiraceae bacterium]
VVLLRGGFQLRPLMPITAAQYVPDMRFVPLMTNTTLGLLFSVQQRHLKRKTYFSPKALDQIFSLQRAPHQDRLQRQENIMLIVLESFGKEYTGFFNDYAGSTPFLDSLLGESYYSDFSYANGLRSTQGIVAISAGIPGLMDDPLMFSAYQSNRVDGIAGLLKKKGYQTAFFHGANEGSMEFERFSKVAGFQDYFDRRDYNNDEDYDGNWGIWDDPFFQYTAAQLNTFEPPFFAQLFSLTSHHPYKVEKWFAEKHPDEEDLYRSVRYTDYALRHFFETASKMPWFENTLFVFTADHVGLSKQASYKTKVGKYRIPIFFYHPKGFVWKDKAPQLIQQSDLLPSIMDYVGYDEPYASFGTSVFDTLAPRYAYMLAEGIYQILDQEYILFFDEFETVGLYQYQNDPLLKENLKEELPAVKARLEKQIKAVIQRHHQAMIENQLSNR